MYILGDKIGEGHHASVYKCFKLVNPLTKSEKKNMLTFDPYLPKPFAVKIVRDDDSEKILAHEREFEILKTLNHKNVVRAIELFSN